MIKKILVSITAVILLIAVYCMIFGFSAEDGEESSGRSELNCRFCVETVSNVFHRNWTKPEMEKRIEALSLPVRKLAHFSEYGVTAIFLFVLVCQWTEPKKLTFLLLVLWIFFTASLDEIHQLYVPGREGKLLDVCIDTSGGIFWLWISNLMQKRRKNENEN